MVYRSVVAIMTIMLIMTSSASAGCSHFLVFHVGLFQFIGRRSKWQPKILKVSLIQLFL